jgi:hypothetical protein
MQSGRIKYQAVKVVFFPYYNMNFNVFYSANPKRNTTENVSLRFIY